MQTFQAVLLSISLAPVGLTRASQQAVPAPPTEPRLFVQYPGAKEFSGRMIARPLQAEDAEQYGLTATELEARARSAAAALASHPIVRHVPETDETIFLVEEGTENEVARTLMAGGEFQYVEPDWRVWPVGCPDDPQFGQQWHHGASRMNSCAGWDIQTGDPSIVVGVCDTGVRVTHQDLQLHRQEGYNAPLGLWESMGGPVEDINGHGTITTGCAAANGDNGTGVSGTGWNLGHRMMRVTNFPNGSAFISDITNGARASSDAGDRVVSVSYEGVNSETVNTTGGYIRGQGDLLVWAAGNGNLEMSGNRNDNRIIVGATTSSDARASFSNYGSLVDLVAPGTGIRSTMNGGDASYGTADGTSFSCPLTAGLVGLIFSANPNLTPQEAENILRAGCDDLGAAGVDNTFGYGRIDVFESLNLTVLIRPTCPGDGSVVDCPCVNNGLDGHGCENSAGTGGALLTATGSVSLANDTAVMTSSGERPTSLTIFLQGTVSIAPAVFGDGLRCAGGTLKRLYTKNASGGTASAPTGAEPSISARSAALGDPIASGTERHYLAFYRDPDPAFCPDPPGSTFNSSGGLSILWN